MDVVARRGIVLGSGTNDLGGWRSQWDSRWKVEVLVDSRMVVSAKGERYHPLKSDGKSVTVDSSVIVDSTYSTVTVDVTSSSSSSSSLSLSSWARTKARERKRRAAHVVRSGAMAREVPSIYQAVRSSERRSDRVRKNRTEQNRTEHEQRREERKTRRREEKSTSGTSRDQLLLGVDVSRGSARPSDIARPVWLDITETPERGRAKAPKTRQQRGCQDQIPLASPALTLHRAPLVISGR